MNARHINAILIAVLLLLPVLVSVQGLSQETTPAVKITLQPGHIQLQAGKPATLDIRIACLPVIMPTWMPGRTAA